MRAPLIYGCLALLSVSSLAGCGLFSSGYDSCDYRPVSHTVVRETVSVPPAPIVATTVASARQAARPTQPVQADKLPAIPIPSLPVASYHDPEEPAPVIAETNPPEPAPIPIKAEALPLGNEGILTVETSRDADSAPIEAAKQAVHDAEPVPIEPAKQAAIAEPSVSLPKAKEIVSVKGAPEKTVQIGHSEDFKVVTGQVQTWRQTVRLRYAGIDQDDQYGGYVVLEGGADLSRLRDGQHGGVRGVLVPPDDPRAPARFRVQSLEMLD